MAEAIRDRWIIARGLAGGLPAGDQRGPSVPDSHRRLSGPSTPKPHTRLIGIGEFSNSDHRPGESGSGRIWRQTAHVGTAIRCPDSREAARAPPVDPRLISAVNHFLRMFRRSAVRRRLLPVRRSAYAHASADQQDRDPMSLRDAPSGNLRRRLDAHRRPPIDMDHLSRQTFGDPELQRKVLAMFPGRRCAWSKG